MKSVERAVAAALLLHVGGWVVLSFGESTTSQVAKGACLKKASGSKDGSLHQCDGTFAQKQAQPLASPVSSNQSTELMEVAKLVKSSEPRAPLDAPIRAPHDNRSDTLRKEAGQSSSVHVGLGTLREVAGGLAPPTNRSAAMRKAARAGFVLLQKSFHEAGEAPALKLHRGSGVNPGAKTNDIVEQHRSTATDQAAVADVNQTHEGLPQNQGLPPNMWASFHHRLMKLQEGLHQKVQQAHQQIKPAFRLLLASFNRDGELSAATLLLVPALFVMILVLGMAAMVRISSVPDRPQGGVRPPVTPNPASSLNTVRGLVRDRTPSRAASRAPSPLPLQRATLLSDQSSVGMPQADRRRQRIISDRSLGPTPIPVQELCPELVVPEDHDCTLVVPILSGGFDRGSAQVVQVTDQRGNPVFRVDLMPDSRRLTLAGISNQVVFASVVGSHGGGKHTKLGILGHQDAPYAGLRFEREAVGGKQLYRLSTPMGAQLHFFATPNFGGFEALDEGNVQLAMAQPIPESSEYKVWIAPLVDAGLIVLCTLGIILLEHEAQAAGS